MSKYLVLIYGNEHDWAAAPRQWHDDNAEQHRLFHARAGAAVVGGNELEPSAKAVTVRGHSGNTPRATDGPFLETKEVIGGYYVLDAANMDDAVALAALIPEAASAGGGVEIRAIVE